MQHKAVSKFQASELMRTSRLKTEQGEAGLGCLGCFCQLLLVLAACDLAAGEKQDLAVLTASSHSSATLVALSWGLHFPLGRVFVKGCAERGVTCSSWKLSVVTAWGPRLKTFIDLISWKVVFFGCYCPLSLPCSPPKELGSVTTKTLQQYRENWALGPLLKSKRR